MISNSDVIYLSIRAWIKTINHQDYEVYWVNISYTVTESKTEKAGDKFKRDDSFIKTPDAPLNKCGIFKNNFVIHI